LNYDYKKFFIIIERENFVFKFLLRFIFKLKDEIDSVWNQMAILVGTFGKEVKELQDKFNGIRK
jgi:hypothetical protein